MRPLRWTDAAEYLQWIGLLGAALVWTGQHIVGFGVTVANCSPGGSHWGLDVRAWEIALMIAAGTLVLLAEAAAITVLRQTQGADHSGEPPIGRRHFFALAAALGNILFLVIILLGGIAATVHQPCHQA